MGVTPPPATMEHHHIKISFALILIFGGVKQITVGRHSLVKTQDESADYNQADLRHNVTAPTLSTKTVNWILEGCRMEQTLVYSSNMRLVERRLNCGDFEFIGDCTILNCSEQLNFPNPLKTKLCVKKCEDDYRSIEDQNSR